MKKLFVVLVLLLAMGCVNNPEPTATPTPVPTPTAVPTPTLTPTPTPVPVPDAPSNSTKAYNSIDVNEKIERGDFVVTIESVGNYNHDSPFGEKLTDYRVDLSIQNTVATEKEYAFDYQLSTNEKLYTMRWFSTLFNKGVIPGGAKINGSLYFDTGNSTGPFMFLVKTRSLSLHDYQDVIGKNSLEKKASGTVVYPVTCGESKLGENYLGALASAGACANVSAARDWFNYPSWVSDGIIITRLKLKNSGEPVNVFVIDAIDSSLNVTAHDLEYTYEPVFLDDYTVGWFVKLGRNEFWKTDVNYSIYLDEVQVGSMPAPVVLAVD